MGAPGLADGGQGTVGTRIERRGRDVSRVGRSVPFPMGNGFGEGAVPPPQKNFGFWISNSRRILI